MMKLESCMNEGEGEIYVGEDVLFGKDVTLNISERLEIGPRSVIGDYAIIEGRDIELGTEFWSDRYIQIGGGSCFEKQSSLRIGYWGHLGRGVFINTARPVMIGNEVGLGTDTKLYTHGAYLSALEGYPVKTGGIAISNRCWLPGAVVLPGVTIGPDTVVGVGSVVTKSLPAGCLAMGVPAKVVKKNVYPATLSQLDRVRWIETFMLDFIENREGVPGYGYTSKQLMIYSDVSPTTTFDMNSRTVDGPASSLTERIKNELRRNGVRFKSYPKDGRYVSWEE